MQQRDPSPPPAERGRRRSLFGSRPEPPVQPPGLPPSAAERAEAVIASYQEMIQEQLDEGLRSIQHTANTLMHDIAAEVWRSAGGDRDAVGSSILQELSRDQAIRSLIAHSDERFQALAARTGRLEDTMNLLAESIRGAREQIERSAEALADAPGSTLGVGQLRAQLDEVTRQVATAFRTLADRDQAIVDTVQEQIREHGELITRETARISQAMEAYVQQGVTAMGQLAGSADSSVEEFAHREEEVSGRVSALVDRQMSELGEQLQLLYDRTAIASTSLHELVSALGERMAIESREAGGETRDAVVGATRQMGEETREAVVGATRQMGEETREAVVGATRQMGEETREAVLDAARAAATAINRTIEQRVSDLAQLVRADSEAIRDELVRRTAEIDERVAAMLDDRLTGATDRTLEVIDRNMIRMVDSLETHFERLSGQVGERAASSVDLAIGARFDDVLARLHESAAVIERGGSEVRGVLDERLSAWDERFTSLDGRFTALAKLTRSDSEAIANQILADQEVTKQALRAMKELQASLPSEVIQMVEQRFASLAESIERSNEMLAHRIDRMAESLGQRQNDDIQIVIDRMGDAMHALASLGKGDERGAAIELE
jgi:archaellum component FlaC